MKCSCTSGGENHLVQTLKSLLVKLPDDVTLTLNGEKFSVKIPGIPNGAICPVYFLCEQDGMKFLDVNLSDLCKHVLGDGVDVHVIMHTQGCVYHGSSYEIKCY